MAQHADILDQPEPIAGPFIGSLLLHGSLIASVFFYGIYIASRPADSLGDPNPGGSQALTVSAVKQIPIPQQQAPPNPVANDTDSMVRSLPSKQIVEQRLPEIDKDAFQIPERVKPKKTEETPRRQQQYNDPAPPNQIPSRSKPAVSNPMYGMTGSGQVGIGPSSPLGSRFGWYAELVRQRIAQNWATNGLDTRSQMSPAIVSFVIERSGNVRDIRVLQSSGNPNIDNTAMRAVYQSNPMTPLPPQITENAISAQFTFNLR